MKHAWTIEPSDIKKVKALGVTVAPLRCQSEESFASDESTVGI